MAPKKDIVGKSEMIKGKENLLIEKEKRYQKKIRKPQVEKQTLLHESKKKAATRPVAKKKK
ncbi:MAG TPA: hypothetical protein VFW78_01760 [Bacteroidia bacterium]|nr:hypothetical protein [Bacteroidia bacterium]